MQTIFLKLFSQNTFMLQSNTYHNENKQKYFYFILNFLSYLPNLIYKKTPVWRLYNEI